MPVDPPAQEDDGWGDESEPEAVPATPRHSALWNYLYADALNKGWADEKFNAVANGSGLEQVAIELGFSEAEWNRIKEEVA